MGTHSTYLFDSSYHMCCYTLCLLVYLVSSQLEQVLSTSLSLNIYFLKMVQTVHTPTKNIQTSIS